MQAEFDDVSVTEFDRADGGIFISNNDFAENVLVEKNTAGGLIIIEDIVAQESIVCKENTPDPIGDDLFTILHGSAGVEDQCADLD